MLNWAFFQGSLGPLHKLLTNSLYWLKGASPVPSWSHSCAGSSGGKLSAAGSQSWDTCSGSEKKQTNKQTKSLLAALCNTEGWMWLLFINKAKLLYIICQSLLLVSLCWIKQSCLVIITKCKILPLLFLSGIWTECHRGLPSDVSHIQAIF